MFGSTSGHAPQEVFQRLKVYYPSLANCIWTRFRPLRNAALRICIENMLNFNIQKSGSMSSQTPCLWASKNALDHMYQGRIIDAYHAHLFTTVDLVPFVRGNVLV